MKRLISYIITILGFVSFVCCQPEELRRPSTDGDATLSISISTNAQAGTKAETAADGDLINDIHIWLANRSDGSIVRYGTATGTNPAVTIDSGSKTATATFSNIERGDYYLYIVANLPSSLNALVSATNVSAIDAAVLPSINASNKPPYGGSGEDAGMPLSVRQEISITAGTNSVSAELLRVCGRIRITVKNNTKDKDIFLQSLSFEDKNPSTGFLIHRTDHAVPGSATLNNPFARFESATTSTDKISPGGEKTYVDQYLYESGTSTLGESFKFNIKGSVFPKGTEQATLDEKHTISYNVAGSPTSDIGNTKWYLIKNANVNRFIYNNSGSLDLTEAIPNLDEFYSETVSDPYLWKFKDSGSTAEGHIQNYGTNGEDGKYLRIPTSTNPGSPYLDASDQDITALYSNDNNGGFQIYIQRFTFPYFYYHQIYNDDGNLATYRNRNIQTGNSFLWQLYEVTRVENLSYSFAGSDLDFSKEAIINYLNNLGQPVPLTHICRNEDVNIRINIYYSPETASFYFTVAPWDTDENETTFD